MAGNPFLDVLERLDHLRGLLGATQVGPWAQNVTFFGRGTQQFSGVG